jgi:hypothetical protein
MTHLRHLLLLLLLLVVVLGVIQHLLLLLLLGMVVVVLPLAAFELLHFCCRDRRRNWLLHIARPFAYGCY